MPPSVGPVVCLSRLTNKTPIQGKRTSLLVMSPSPWWLFSRPPPSPQPSLPLLPFTLFDPLNLLRATVTVHLLRSPSKHTGRFMWRRAAARRRSNVTSGEAGKLKLLFKCFLCPVTETGSSTERLLKWEWWMASTEAHKYPSILWALLTCSWTCLVVLGVAAVIIVFSVRTKRRLTNANWAFPTHFFDF